MIRFFRRALSSWLVLGLFGLIMVAFIVTGVGTPGGLEQLTGSSQDTVAHIGGERLRTGDALESIQLAHKSAQQDQPMLTMERFAREGGVEMVINQLISQRTLDVWAHQNGIMAGKRLVDGQIAGMTVFNGPTGQFDETVFRATLAQRGLGEQLFRREIASSLIRRQLYGPLANGFRTPSGIAIPYATQLLEARRGEIAVVPVAALPKATAPTDADIKSWYGRNIARYTLPESRVISYALFGIEQLKAPIAPTETEIAAAYKADAAKYGAKETRSFSQVVLPAEAAAKALYAKIKAGTAFAVAAKAAGFSPADTTLGAQSRAQLAGIGNAALADAAFKAAAGETLAPVKSPLGWHVLHVDAVNTAAGTTLAQARAEIVARLEAQKREAALTELAGEIEDQVADGASFDEVVKARGLKVVTSPAVTADGRIPGSPAPLADPVLAALLKTAFDAAPDDDPTVETLGGGQAHALLKVTRVVPAAPIALAAVRDRVVAAIMADRGLKRSKAIAEQIKAKIDKGLPLATALSGADIPLPAPQQVGARRIDLIRAAQSGAQVPPPLAALFSAKKGGAKLVAIPGGQGWFIVRLDTVEAGDINSAPDLVELTRNEFTNQVMQELAEQFSADTAKSLGVKRNDVTISNLKARLAKGNSDQ